MSGTVVDRIKNKATSFHLGQLKAKLAKLKRELLTPTTGGGQGGNAGVGASSLLSLPFKSQPTNNGYTLTGFDVARTGIASVGFM
ncbi:hypothetical protein P7C70_g5801, partial [Phenoliferia sp. Uapishka_3]